MAAAAESWLKLTDAGGVGALWEEAAFANKPSAVETVNPMLDPDGVWRVSGYWIR